MNHKALALLAATLLCLVHPARAHDVNPLQVSTFWTVGGMAVTDVALSGNYIYISQGTNGLAIGNAIDPVFSSSAFGWLGSVDTPGFASAVAISGDLALVADGSAGLKVINVSNRTSPKIVGGYYTDGNCIGVVAVGNLAYLADSDLGLDIVDFSNSAQPTRIGGYNTFGTANAVAVSGNYAYVADGNDGLVVIDVSNPASARRVGGYDRLPASNITVAGSYAYVSSNGSLITFDVSDPTNPQPLSTLVLPGPISAISVAGPTGYVTSPSGGFHIVDFTDPFLPKVSASNYSVTNGLHVITSGSLAFVAAQADGVRIVSIANPAALDVVGHLSIPGGIRDVAVLGNYVCVVDGQALEIVDASNASKMRIVGKYPGFPSASNVVCVKRFAIVSSTAGSAPQVIDLADPQNPVEVTSLANSRIVGPYVVEDTSSGFSVSTISDDGYPSGGFGFSPTDSQFRLRAVAIVGTNAFVIATQKQTCCIDPFGPYLLKFDITSGQLLQEVGAPPAKTLFAKDTYLGASLFDGGLQLLDADDFHSLATLQGTGGADFDFSPNTFYIANGRAGIQVAEFSDALPALSNVGGVALPDATAVAVGPNNVFVGAGTNGLYALTQYQPLVRLEAAMNTNHTPLVRVLAPIGSSGRIQRASTLKTNSFQDWQYIQLNSYPQILTDTNSRSAFYRFVSP
jgi:hypothetical protein